MKNATLNQYRLFVTSEQTKINNDPRNPTRSDNDLHIVIEQKMDEAKAYLKAHGKLAHPWEMALWWSINRPTYNFSLTEQDKAWLCETAENMSEDDLTSYRFTNAPSARLTYLIACLQDTASQSGIYKQEDAYAYMMENCPPFASRLNEICDRS